MDTQSPEVVIVDDKGAEHHFPAGFDPQKAIAIVRGSAGQSYGQTLTEGLKGAGAELVDQAKGVNTLAQTLGGIARNVIHGDSDTRKATLSGFITGAKDAISHPKEMLTAADPTGVSAVMRSDESTPRKVGRGVALAGELALPFLRPIARLRGLGQAGKVAEEAGAALGHATPTAESLGDAAGLVAKTSTESTPIAKGPISAPLGNRFTVGRAVKQGEARVTGTGGNPVMLHTAPAQLGEQVMVSVPVTDQAAANGAMKAEAAGESAGRTEPPGRPPLYSGEERRSPTRVQSDVEDAAYQHVREAIERKNAKARAQAMLIRPAEKAGTTAEATARTPPSSTAAPASTDSLTAMREKYGPVKAAEMAGMKDTVELDSWIEAGPGKGRAERAAQLYASKRGATKANRVFGTDMPSTEKIPTEAVDRIKAKAAEELAADGKVSAQTQSLLDRIKGERGAVKVSGLLVGGGAVGGAVLGGAAPANNPDDRVWNAVGGGLAGASLGLAPSLSLGKIGKNLLAARQAGFLSGGALVKHGLTGLGAAVGTGIENAPAGGPLAAAGRLAPLAEMLRLPTNIKEFGKSWKGGAIGPYGVDPDVLPALKIPNRLIGSAIDTQHKALARAGVPQADIDRYLLTKNNSLFGGMQDLDNNGMKVARTIVPFSRVPANLFTEGANALGDLAEGASWKNNKNVLTLGSMAGGAALQKWAGTDPKKIYIARLLLAGFGPRNLPAIIGGLGGAALSGNISARKTIGDISPIPEVESAKSLIGYKPAIWTALQKLGVVATPEK